MGSYGGHGARPLFRLLLMRAFYEGLARGRKRWLDGGEVFCK